MDDADEPVDAQPRSWAGQQQLDLSATTLPVLSGDLSCSPKRGGGFRAFAPCEIGRHRQPR